MPTDDDRPLFAERLWPSPGIWVVTTGFGAALGLIPAAVSGTAAVVVAAVGVVAVAVLMVAGTPTVTLTRARLSAGRASIPVELVSGVQTLDAAAMRQARGVRLDARAYLCLRGWLPQGVKVVLDDPEDPTPYWLISSRRPEAFAAAFTTASGRLRPPG